MKADVIKIIVNFVVTGLLGYIVASFKNFKKKKKEKEDKILIEIENLKKKQEEVEKEQLLEMKSELTNKFYVYNAMDEVEDYLVMSFREQCERYFKRGGDSWIHPMYEKSFDWDIKPSGYLNWI